MKVLFIFGTRPEAIKLIPLVFALQRQPGVQTIVCSTGQHKEMLDQVLQFFQVDVDYSLHVMSANQTLSELTVQCVSKLDGVVKEVQPDLIFVQGDTTTAFAGGLVGFYNRVKVAHVEAGLRSFNRFSPYPEEVNRKMISTFADHHFCPTEQSKQNLIAEGYQENIHVVGNTVIDALFLALERISGDPEQRLQLEERFSFLDPSKKMVLVTCHRRENFGRPLENIVSSLLSLSKRLPDVEFLIPVHLNPNVRQVIYDRLGKQKNFHLHEPLDYPSLIWAMNRSFMVLTDSGGIQEEAPSLGKPVLVLRQNTERPEGVQAGNARLVGADSSLIEEWFTRLVSDTAAYCAMTTPRNPYGDGTAAQQILTRLFNSPVL